MHRKVPAWFGGGERGKGPSTWEDTSPRSLSCHLAYVLEHAGHALIGARQWIPAAQIADPARSAAIGLPPGLEFRTKGQLASDPAGGRLGAARNHAPTAQPRPRPAVEQGRVHAQRSMTDDGRACAAGHLRPRPGEAA